MKNFFLLVELYDTDKIHMEVKFYDSSNRSLYPPSNQTELLT